MSSTEVLVRLSAPQIYPAISGAAKSFLSPLNHLQIVAALGHPQVLVSAYDVGRALPESRRGMIKLLEEMAAAGVMIMMDSGCYERHWLRDPSWHEDDFLAVVESVPAQMVLTFDGHQDEQADEAKSIDAVCGAIDSVLRVPGQRLIVPIVHGSTPKQMAQILSGVHRRVGATMYACPERETGDGLLAGCATVCELRTILGDGVNCPILHLLGAGNPRSVLAYASAGASSFDGLDWCQTATDFDTATLHHSRQLDFFAGQSRFEGEATMSYSARLLGHNLTFLRHWNSLLAAAADSGDWAPMLAAWLPAPIAKQLSGA